MISKILNKNLDDVKDSLKKADVTKKGYLSVEQMNSIMKKFGINIASFEYFKQSDGSVDYIKFLKYYL